MPPGFRMTIGADRNEVARVQAAFAEFAEAHALPASVRRSVSVVLDELATNAYAYGGAGEVSVEAQVASDRVSVTLTDDGNPFDPFAVPPPSPDSTLPVEERQIGGVGIHLVRQMMDEVSYERRADRNVVVVTKLLKGGGRSMEITTRTQRDVTLVVFGGHLDSNTSPQAQQALDAILAGGARKVVVDFTALDYISSAGLRVLLGAAKRLRGVEGGALRLFGLNDTVREVFQISGFSTILAVFGTEADALKGL